MTVNSRSPSRACPSRRSRVTPGSSSTSASFCPTRRLNSVDLPTLGRPIMAIVNDMDHPGALYAARINECEMESAREASARQRRGECGLLLGLRLLLLLCLLGRLRRLICWWCRGAPAHNLGLRRRRGCGNAVFFLGRRGIRIGWCGCRGCGGLLGLALRALGFRLDRRRRCRDRVLFELLLARALVEILRHALLQPRHALGEDRFAFAG